MNHNVNGDRFLLTVIMYTFMNYGFKFHRLLLISNFTMALIISKTSKIYFQKRKNLVVLKSRYQKFTKSNHSKLLNIPKVTKGVLAQWCDPLTSQPEQSGGMGSTSSRTPSLERHYKGSRTQLGLLYFCNPRAWC